MTIHPAALGVTNHNYIGKSQFGDPALQGTIDDFRIYGRALSAAEILNLAKPTIVNAVAPSASPVTTATTTLSVLGSDITAGESALTYTWSTVGTPPAPVSFSINGTNAAKNTVATFTQPGTYTFQVTIDNPAAGSTFAVTSSTIVTVNRTLSTIVVNPPSVNLNNGATQSFTATGLDQFGVTLSPQPMFSWSASGGSITSSGGYTAPFAGGDFQVTATSGSVSSSATAHVSLIKGDVNGDGTVSGADISALMAALADLSDYQSAHQFVSGNLLAVADIDGNQTVNNLDVQSLISLVANAASGGGSGSAAFSSEALPPAHPDVTVNELTTANGLSTVSLTTMSATAVVSHSNPASTPPVFDTAAPATIEALTPSSSVSHRLRLLNAVWPETDPISLERHAVQMGNLPLVRDSQDAMSSRNLGALHDALSENQLLDELFANWAQV